MNYQSLAAEIFSVLPVAQLLFMKQSFLKAEESIGLAAVSVAARELSGVADRIARGRGQVDRR